jgi:hypothetical protein
MLCVRHSPLNITALRGMRRWPRKAECCPPHAHLIHRCGCPRCDGLHGQASVCRALSSLCPPWTSPHAAWYPGPGCCQADTASPVEFTYSRLPLIRTRTHRERGSSVVHTPCQPDETGINRNCGAPGASSTAHRIGRAAGTAISLHGMAGCCSENTASHPSLRS